MGQFTPLLGTVIARLPFDTVIGENDDRIEWQLDIIENGSSHTGEPLELVGDGSSPIQITWHKDRDIYKPILGSTAKINLWVPNSTYVLPDFNAGSQFQYETRLRRISSESGVETITDYWCGYINPVASNEQVGTFPFPVSFTATDRLGLLEQQSLIYANVIHDPSLIGYIGRALRQTGLELPLYVDSGIRNANGDALTDVSASAFSFFDEDSTPERLGDRATLKEALEGVLETFNCRVFQSEGAWWVVNCSLHGTDTDIDTTYAQYVPDTGMTGRDAGNLFPGEAGYASTLNIEEYVRSTTEATITVPTLRYNLDGTPTEDLSVVGGDLNLSLRRPVGSVEARPEGLFQDPLSPNPDFRDKSDGWEGNLAIRSFVGTLPADVSQDGDLFFSEIDGDFRTGERSIITNRFRFALNTIEEKWFESTDGFAADQGSSTQVSFDWKYNNLLTGPGRDPVDPRIPFRIRLDLDSPVTVNASNTSTFHTLIGIGPLTTSTLYWDFIARKWTTSSQSAPQRATDTLFSANRASNIDGTTNIDSGGEEDEWTNVSVDVAAYSTFDGFFETLDLPDGTINVEFWLPQATRRGRSRNVHISDGNGDLGLVRILVDNVSVTDNFDDSVDDPIYEYVQPLGTRTIDYEPSFISSGPDTFRQFLTSGGNPVTETSFWRKDETNTSGRTLEELITGQKLIDHKDRLRYFEGNLVNRTLTPLSLHHKININYDGYSDNSVCQLNGGSFDVKQNLFDVAMYQPDSNTLTPGLLANGEDQFFSENVDLVAGRFPGRSTKVRYALAIIPRGLNGTTVVADSITTDVMNNVLDITGSPGDVITKEISFTPGTGFISNLASTTIRPDSATEPRPFHITFMGDGTGDDTFRNQQATVTQSGTTLGGSIVLPISIRIPEDSDFDELHVDVAITPFVPELVPGATAASVVITNNIPNTTPLTQTFNTSGLPGTGQTFEFKIQPDDGFQIPAGNVSVLETDTDLTNEDATDNGNGASITFTYVVPTTPESVAVTVQGASVPAGQLGVDIFTRTITFENDIDFVRSFEDSNVFTGVAGQVIPYDLILIPGNNHFIDSGNFAIRLPASTGGSQRGAPYQSGQNVGIPLNIEIADPGNGNIDISGTATVTGLAEEEPYSLTFNPNNVGLSGSSVSLMPSFQRFDVTDFNDSITPVELTISSDTGMVFTSIDQVEIDVNEAAVATNNQGTIFLPEAQFVVSPAAVPIVDGNLVFNIAGTYPSSGGQYTIDVNVRGAANYAGQYGLVAEGARVLYSATDDRGPQRFRTAFVNIVTSPEIGRFELVGNPVGATLGINMNGVTVSRSIPLGPALAQDTTFTVRHLDDPTLTATVVVSESLTEAEQPATMGSLSTNRTTTSSNGGTLQYTVSGVDGLWEMRFSDSPTLPFAGPGPLNNSIISFSAPSGGSNDIGGTLTYGNNGDYLRQGNRLAYIHLIAAGQTTGSSLATVQLIGAAGPVYGEQTITTLNRAPRAGDADGLYIQFP